MRLGQRSSTPIDEREIKRANSIPRVGHEAKCEPMLKEGKHLQKEKKRISKTILPDRGDSWAEVFWVNNIMDQFKLRLEI